MGDDVRAFIPVHSLQENLAVTDLDADHFFQDEFLIIDKQNTHGSSFWFH